MYIRFWWKNQKERDYYEDTDVDGRILLNGSLRTRMGVVWPGLIWLRIYIPVAGSCEHGNEPSDSIKY
jgi:hypothetical protein